MKRDDLPQVRTKELCHVKIDLYTRAWNDAHMLEFFFRHYDPLVRTYYIFDDGSTDGTLDMLRAHPRVALGRFVNTNEDSRILSTVTFFDSCWKQSRGDADWVITTDIDEHIHHPDLPAYLAACQRSGVTLVPALGYQMLSETFPAPGQNLAHTLTHGQPWIMMNKLNIFSPEAIDEVRFSPGRHSAKPEGRLVLPPRDDLLLLHYKYLDFDRVQARHEASAPRSRSIDLERRFGHKYFWSAAQLRDDWERVRAGCVDVASADLDPHASHPERRWWAKYPRAAPEAFAG